MEQLDKTTLTQPTKTDEMFSLFLTNTMAYIEEYNAALDWLERSINWGFSNHRFLSECNPFMKPLREVQRFRALLSLAKEEHEGFHA